MTQAAEAGSGSLRIFSGSAQPRRPIDSQQVCEIVGRVAADVLSEVRTGTWHPPATLRIDPRLHGCRVRKDGSSRTAGSC